MDIDPASGVPRSRPRRVTVNGGINASFSPDGKWLAYNRTDDDTHPLTDLLVVPAAGGVARRLITANLAMPTQWSPDGRWIYYVVEGPKSAFADGSAEFDTYRIRTDGSTPQLIGRAAGTWPGFTDDGRFLVTRSGGVIDTLRHAVVADASGKPIATFTTAAGDEIGHWVDNYRFLTVRDDRKGALRIADVNTGATHDVLATTSPITSAAFSPDGKRIAIFQRRGGRTNLLVMDVNGSNRRVAPLRNMTSDAQLKWSPDSRFIAYIAGLDAPRTINLYDVAASVHRVIVSGSHFFGRDILWRPNSNAIMYTRVDTVGASPELASLSLHEVVIGGSDRQLRLIPREVLSTGKSPTEIRLGDSAAISVGTSGVWLVPYSGGAARLLKRGTTTRTSFTPDGRSLVHGIDPHGDGSFGVLEVLGLDGTIVRDIKLPFRGFPNANDRHVAIAQNGHEAIVQGSSAGVTKIFSVPLDGSASRAILALPTRFPSQLVVSPDGRSILYTVVGPETSSFVLVDLTKELARLSSRH